MKESSVERRRRVQKIYRERPEIKAYLKKYNKEWGQKNAEKIRGYTKKHYWKHIERNRVYHQKRRTIIKDHLFDVLGHQCARCGFTDKRALQFDHINGGGIKDSMRFKKNNDTMIRHYSNNADEAREKLQVLCANCNWIKRNENNEV